MRFEQKAAGHPLTGFVGEAFREFLLLIENPSWNIAEGDRHGRSLWRLTGLFHRAAR